MRNISDSGRGILDQNEVLKRIFRAKRLRRRELSRLPFKKKIEILLQLQNMAEGVKRSKRERDNHIWMK
jgi:hypothetical protein